MVKNGASVVSSCKVQVPGGTSIKNIAATIALLDTKLIQLYTHVAI